MYDLAVIGAGPGGYVAAIRAARKGMKVLLVEKEEIGGTCLNRGCIPTKALLSDVKPLHRLKSSPVYRGIDGVTIDLDRMLDRKEQVVKTLAGGLTAILRSCGITIVKGKGELPRPDLVRVWIDGKPEDHHVRKVIIATGSKPLVPPSIPVDGDFVITSDEALSPRSVPEEMVIVGGGVIGVEFATLYRFLGTKVTIVEMLPDILMTEDIDVRKGLRSILERQGVEIHVQTKVIGVQVKDGKVMVFCEDREGKEHQLGGNRVLVAAGRSPCLEGIDLDRLGIATDGPFIKVNPRMETSVPGIYAIGDVIGGKMLAHVAMEEAEVAVDNILGRPREVNYTRMPNCIFTFPEVGSIGMTEEEARQRGGEIKVGKFSYAFSGRAQAEGSTDGFVKVIADPQSGEILGAHILGERATDLIGEVALAMTTEAVVEDLSAAVKGHPTFSECLKEAALAWEGRPLHFLGGG